MSGRILCTCCEVDVVLVDPLENRGVAQCVVDAAAAMFTELLDMIDEDKQTANYDDGLGSIALRIHESRDACERHRAFWETRKRQIEELDGAIDSSWPSIDPRWIPLVSYISSGPRRWMEAELAKEILSASMAISPRVDGLLNDEPSVAEVAPGENHPKHYNHTEVVKRVTEQGLDARLVGTWKACDATIDRITIGSDGSFVNHLHSSTKYPNGIRGGVRVQLWNDTPVFLLSTSASGKDETLAYEFEFVTDDIVVLRYRPYPPDRKTSPEELYCPAGSALLRMTPEGTYSEDDHARVRKINEELDYFVPR